jgi:hypothetical protein
MSFLDEQNTLNAISTIQENFPAAATFLTYALLERCLKLYLLENYKNTTLNLDCDLKVGKKHKNTKALNDFQTSDGRTFINEFLNKCTLGTLEKIYSMPDKRYSDHRNTFFHSQVYITAQMGQTYDFRHLDNKRHLAKAKKNLIEASKIYFHHQIVERENKLQFDPPV